MTHLNNRILDGLLVEALVLKSELTHVIDNIETWRAGLDQSSWAEVDAKIERASRQMMRADRWLLDHKDYFDGKVSFFRLRFSTRLAAEPRIPTSDRAALLPDLVRETIDAIESFVERLLVIERSWGGRNDSAQSAIRGIRQRLGQGGDIDPQG